MKHCFYLLLTALLLMGSASNAARLKVFELNLWMEGDMVENGFDRIVDEICHADADLVMLCEVGNHHGLRFTPRLVKALRARGHNYYGNDSTNLDVAILSRQPLTSQTEVSNQQAILRCTTTIAGREIAVYAAHLDYTHYACYLPRGYDGATWKEMAQPITDEEKILEANRESTRDETIRVFVDQAKADVDAGRLVFLAGDFNEPSHLDWKAGTRHLWDHNGATVKWDCSWTLYQNGYRDAYRVVHPNVKRCPGFTFPADNQAVPVRKLTWAPKADERDRIDFIYYYPQKGVKPTSACIVGPSGSIVRSQRQEERTKDPFITPVGVWPSDHKGLLTEFKI